MHPLESAAQPSAPKHGTAAERAGTVPADQQTAVDKALVLLQALAEHDGEMGVSELSRRTRLTKSTAFRLLGILQRNQAVERVGSNYRLGSRLFDIGTRVYGPGSLEMRELLLPHLADLYEATHRTVHLAVLRGTDVFYLNKLQGHRAGRAPSRIGARLPAHCTAVGKALLAFDHDTAEQAIAEGLPALTPHTVTRPEELRAELARIRREGVAFESQGAALGLSCAAVPVMGAAGRPVAAFSVADHGPGFEPRRYAGVLRRIAHEAGRAVAAATAAEARRRSGGALSA